MVATAVFGGFAAHSTVAQDASPVSEVPGVVGALFDILVEDMPPAPVQVTLARVVSQPGDGDLEDYFTLPGPLAFILESGIEVCRCGAEESPCLLLHADGTNEPAPVIPTDIMLGPGEGLYIPANTPDSYFIPGPDPVSEIDLSMFPVESPAATPA
jgi:hypothetical protein